MVDTKVYVAIVLVLVVIIVYFLAFAPKSTSTNTSTLQTTTILANESLPNQSTVTTTINYSAQYNESAHAWAQTDHFPTPLGFAKCVFVGNYSYCIGGTTNANYTSNAYVSPTNRQGRLAWSETIPTQIIPDNCLVFGSQIDCITGRLLSTHAVINTTYYSYSIPGVGLSQWNESTTYPANAATDGCAISGADVYCTGGIAANNSYISLSYYAPLSSNGTGTWQQTISLPVQANPQCFAYSHTVYCVGSYVNSTGHLNNFDFYAPTFAYGIDSWKASTPPPNPPGTYSCSFYNKFIYCIGGAINNTNSSQIWYTGLSTGGVNGWHEAVPFPFLHANATSCATYQNTTYCAGGKSFNDTLYIDNVTYTRSFI